MDKGKGKDAGTGKGDPGHGLDKGKGKGNDAGKGNASEAWDDESWGAWR